MYLGMCGDKCEACPRYIATQNNDIGFLTKIRDLYVRSGHRPPNTDPESLRCSGCKENRNCAYPGLRSCVVWQKLENCGKCMSYPCWRCELMLSKVEVFKEKMKGKASDEEMKMLEEAFFRKKEYLDKVRK